MMFIHTGRAVTKRVLIGLVVLAVLLNGYYFYPDLTHRVLDFYHSGDCSDDIIAAYLEQLIHIRFNTFTKEHMVVTTLMRLKHAYRELATDSGVTACEFLSRSVPTNTSFMKAVSQLDVCMQQVWSWTLLCTDYSEGTVAGSLCEPLCTKGEIKLTKCFGAHALKLHVFKADWNGRPIVVKSMRRISQHFERVGYFYKHRPLGYDSERTPLPQRINEKDVLTRKQLFEQINITLFYGLYGTAFTDSQQTRKVLDKAISECDLHGDGTLHYGEIVRCWELIETEEYVLGILLHGNPGLAEIYGVCGNLYAEEFVPSINAEQYLGYEQFLTAHKPWKLRAKMALALLDMVEAIEDTPYGTLYYCDVKELNVGVIEEPGGNFIAKVMDLDEGFLGPVMTVVKFQRNVLNQSCEIDSDCDFVKCHLACNTTSRTCTDRVISNNLQVLCQRIFMKEEMWRPHILQNPPSAIEQELDRILYACANPNSDEDSSHIDRHLLSKFRNLLLASVQV